MTVHVLGRRRTADLPTSVAFSEWNALTEPPQESLAGAGAVIHLAGEPVAQRWTEDARLRIRNSRVEGTRHMVQRSVEAGAPARVLHMRVCDRDLWLARRRSPNRSIPPGGSDFLSRVVVEWEDTAKLAETLGIRVVRLRFGMVLGQGGALAKMLPPFRLGIGGRIGSGRQWMSWIHIEDAASLVLFAMQNASSVCGPINATAPNPVTNAEFTRELAACPASPRCAARATLCSEGHARRNVRGCRSQASASSRRPPSALVFILSTRNSRPLWPTCWPAAGEAQ